MQLRNIPKGALMYNKKMIAKAFLPYKDELIELIDRYIAKSDEKLKDSLEEEGFVNPGETVEHINLLEEELK